MTTEVGANVKSGAIERRQCTAAEHECGIEATQSVDADVPADADAFSRIIRDVISRFILALECNEDKIWNELLRQLRIHEKELQRDSARRQLSHYLNRIRMQLPGSEAQTTVLDSTLRIVGQEFISASDKRQYKVFVEKQECNRDDLEGTVKEKDHTCKDEPLPKEQRTLMRMLQTYEIRPPPLTMKDLTTSIENVTDEVSKREATWQSFRGNTAMATGMALPEETLAHTAASVTQTLRSTSVKMRKDASKSPTTAPNKKDTDTKLTGRQAVERFIKLQHSDKEEFLYFNINRNRTRNPYDLINVPQCMADAEHFVFSAYGVLHVTSGRKPLGKLSLAEWQREAVIVHGLLQLSFFRDFSIRKSFFTWKQNARHQKKARINMCIRNSLVLQSPLFVHTLQAVQRELLSLDSTWLDLSTTSDRVTAAARCRNSLLERLRRIQLKMDVLGEHMALATLRTQAADVRLRLQRSHRRFTLLVDHLLRSHLLLTSAAAMRWLASADTGQASQTSDSQDSGMADGGKVARDQEMSCFCEERFEQESPIVRGTDRELDGIAKYELSEKLMLTDDADNASNADDADRELMAEGTKREDILDTIWLLMELCSCSGTKRSLPEQSTRAEVRPHQQLRVPHFLQKEPLRERSMRVPPVYNYLINATSQLPRTKQTHEERPSFIENLIEQMR
ncbi:PREDICTED: uncharacterized protein LOC106808495 [Priapulus caudatus]|uniref:Uncharacterized protein LOC106808495 n=1 Tax=Priapulus caudatus TaxID=37621 RepID=A0ABM1E3F2_PRICU|nr:PREDICTED: uncharacterized protein LOC106808495 [Priapulus caudatus]